MPVGLPWHNIISTTALQSQMGNAIAGDWLEMVKTLRLGSASVDQVWLPGCGGGSH